jgi:CRP-like cAMP-binding protein
MENNLELTFINFKKGSYITIEGKQNTGYFYIIREGKVKTSKEITYDGGKNVILGPGDLIGVVSAMSYQNHIETTVALSDVVAIKVLQQQYYNLIQKNPSVVIKIIRKFSQQLRHLNDTLVEHTINAVAHYDPTHLFNVAEYYLKQKQFHQAFYTYAKYFKYCPQGNNIPVAKEKMAKIMNIANEVQLDFKPEQLNRTFKKNNMIFAEGEPGNELFVIQKGSVKIIKIADDKETLLAVLKVGDIFGEMALLEDKPRLASAVAYEDCSVMAINKANFELMITNQPQLIAKVTSLLADRIWLIYKKLDNARIIDPMGRLYNTVYIQLEKNRIPLDGKNTPPTFTFGFGWSELFAMTGLPIEHKKTLQEKLSKNSKVKIYENQIHVTSIMDIVRQCEYYRKMGKIDRQNKSQSLQV